MTGPSLSSQRNLKRAPSPAAVMDQVIETLPLGSERDPYFEALVANSCKTSANVCTILPSMMSSGPSTWTRAENGASSAPTISLKRRAFPIGPHQKLVRATR
jgi:hypothetical protein